MGKRGLVSLVGAGPGDPGLITVAGLDRLRRADVVIFDRLIDQRLLDETKFGAELIDAGKSRGKQNMSQKQINALRLERARSGKYVCRLKGGDPFVFGRGGEEALALSEAQIRWEVIPGVTSVVAAPAYAGIPITQRGMATSFTVVTGSQDTSRSKSKIDWHTLARVSGTLIFVMTWKELGTITSELIENGAEAQRPAAVIQWGTTNRQKVVTGTLENIAALSKSENLGPPAVLVVGQVASLRGVLAWFDQRPLFGKRVLVTRMRGQATQLSRLLEGQGAIAIETPVIRVNPLEETANIDRAVKNLSTYDWVTFSSINGVSMVKVRIEALGLDGRIFHGTKVAAIGPTTAQALLDIGVRADLVPEAYISEAVAARMIQDNVEGLKVLLFRSDIGRDALARSLRERGAIVNELVAYRTETNMDASNQILQAFSDEHGVDITTFTSASCVDSMLEIIEGDVTLINKTLVACIGPITASQARNRGLKVSIVANEHTIQGLVNAVVEHVSGNGS